MKTKIYLLVLIFRLISSLGFAQEAINLTQYNTAISIINPAYSGVSGRFTTQLISRNQWVGINGAPKTNILLVNSPITRYNIGMGASLICEKIGPVNEFKFSINTAYHTKLTDKIHMSLGLKSMISLYKMDYIGDELIDAGDPYFQDIQSTRNYLNFGAGIYIYTKKFYIAYSATPLLKNKIKDIDETNARTYTINNTIQHYLSASYSFKMNDNFIVKPSILLKATNTLKPTSDLSLTTIYSEKFWFGVSYKTNKNLGIFTQLQIGEKFRIGYAFDFGLSKNSVLNNGSHELVCTMDIQMTKKQFITPRYF